MNENNEYFGTATNAQACYSNLNQYGGNGRIQPIVNPLPATTTPQLFWRLRPNRIQGYMMNPALNNCIQNGGNYHTLGSIYKGTGHSFL